ncbi:unnamed protein product [Chondrus crispus]|uniref:Uncharacterized protein n=1 Tax=Chondrus crispus TaxID=2769 RepID=R7QJG6_CHOCR|nr:unnamed protein product [Chondrus crispus]CDF38244.1 unnamed protein product [Chondrus crispus]|eukprot:XP_005718129.1 unnamed protein product [Chondrus crispus]
MATLTHRLLHFSRSALLSYLNPSPPPPPPPPPPLPSPPPSTTITLFVSIDHASLHSTTSSPWPLSSHHLLILLLDFHQSAPLSPSHLHSPRPRSVRAPSGTPCSQTLPQLPRSTLHPYQTLCRIAILLCPKLRPMTPHLMFEIFLLSLVPPSLTLPTHPRLTLAYPLRM